MLTSKLIFVIFTWGMALLVSISLRAAGIFHPQPFSTNHLLVWFLVFGPSILLLIFFMLKRYLSADSLISSWGWSDFKFFICLFYFHFKPWSSRLIDFWSKDWYMVDCCTYFVWFIIYRFCCSMVCWTICWKAIRKFYEAAMGIIFSMIFTTFLCFEKF